MSLVSQRAPAKETTLVLSRYKASSSKSIEDAKAESNRLTFARG
jgi:hypothetical protein